MPKQQTNGNLALVGFDDIFSNTASHTTAEYIKSIPLVELFPPEFHPFQVRDDAAMDSLVKSIRQYGVREPGLARPRAGGRYELLAGNRRKRACELAGIAELPVIIREMDDDEAAIAMVDSNLEQREKLLPSEKAWAYRVKLEALNHRGAKSDKPGELSVDILCEQTGESKSQIFRLIRLTELVPALADKADDKKLAFNPAVELSYLSRAEQTILADCMEKYEVRPSLSQAQRLRKASQEGGLTVQSIEEIFVEPKEPSRTTSIMNRFERYFPAGYTQERMEIVIVELLSEWQTKYSE